MEREAFERSLKAFVRRTPFHPFVVELVSGALVEVDHPEALVFRGGVAVHFNQDGIPTLFDHQGVARLARTTDLEEALAALEADLHAQVAARAKDRLFVHAGVSSSSN